MIGAKVAVRSVVRNRRRSLMTVGSIAVGTAAILLIGALLAHLLLSIETATVRRVGHLTIFKAGYSDFGAVNPLRYSIPDYERVIRRLREDSELRSVTRVITPVQSMFGLISSPDSGASKTFFGRGVIWSDRQTMAGWDPYRLNLGGPTSASLRDDDANAAIIGEGVARVLGLCERLRVERCKSPPKPVRDTSLAAIPDEDFSSLAELDGPVAQAPAAGDSRPAADLLASTPNGAPNVMRVYVDRAERQVAKELDDNAVAVQLGLAQSLVYGRNPPEVSGLIVQLNETVQLPRAEARLKALFREPGMNLEYRTYEQLTPFYAQTRAFFKVLFTFISIIVGLIVVFTVSNAMMMSVLERTSEIGTMRALGAQQGAVRNQFLLEGTVLGSAGAGAGALLALLLAFALNRSGLTWQPPTAAAPMPFRLYLAGETALILAVPLLLVVVACVASWLPARRAGRMTIVEALRHV
ncbi:MAG TPA: FtsX-like permease family protein [Allosphingosinicella sp.]|nr:FtsX-like permease family protein [Allosphingosinicella sp.]